MADSGNVSGGIQHEDDQGAYDPILRSLKCGLVVSFNDSDPSAHCPGELTVDYHDRDRGVISLTTNADEPWRVTYQNRTGPKIKRLDNEGYPRQAFDITTIEVLAIDA